MPINRLILEIDDQLMTEKLVTFNVIDFYWLSSITIDFHRLLSRVILSRSLVWGLRKSIYGYHGEPHVCREMSMTIDSNWWQSIAINGIRYQLANNYRLISIDFRSSIFIDWSRREWRMTFTSKIVSVPFQYKGPSPCGTSCFSKIIVRHFSVF